MKCDSRLNYNLECLWFSEDASEPLSSGTVADKGPPSTEIKWKENLEWKIEIAQKKGGGIPCLTMAARFSAVKSLQNANIIL